ncbi:MAG: EAL domain-containing protein, partial [Desulfuromonadales bacterium]|nr:EAL domain-containing protein [Desulfuromonadales bacterium]
LMVVHLLFDVTELRKAEKKVDYLERYDRLTGLPNQRLFQEHLKAEIAHSKRQQSHLAVFAIDLDFFKKINAVFGHDLGDELLKDVAQRIKGCIRTEDTLARFGGDSFILMLRNIRYDEDASIVAEKILHSFCLPFQIQQQDVFASVSIGVALFPLDGADVRTLIRNSDAALHRAKEMGRNAYLFFASEMNKRVVEQMELQNSLQHALKRDEFVLHYQPQLDALSGDMIGVEALLRWRHPKRGLIYPNDFIPLAEQTGLILSIEEWVLRTACLAAKSWNEQGDELLRVSVNLSPHQFQRQDVFEMVRKIVAETGVQPEWLGLEITESTVMKDVEHAVDMFQQLKDLGLHLSVDDFGTGYSSLSYLKKFPIDLLKIDRSFITDIPAECDDIAIVSAIISMAHKLEIKVLAEGVETAAQKDFLHSVKCDEFQGFYFSTPVVANTVTLKRQDALETRPS